MAEARGSAARASSEIGGYLDAGLAGIGGSHRPSAFARSTAATPAVCIRPSDTNRITISTFRFDHGLRARRGVKR